MTSIVQILGGAYDYLQVTTNTILVFLVSKSLIELFHHVIVIPYTILEPPFYCTVYTVCHRPDSPYTANNIQCVIGSTCSFDRTQHR